LSQSHIDSTMLPPVGLVFVGLSLYCLAIILIRIQSELLWRERRQHWVRVFMLEVN
jgi:hypothetical protein